MYNMWVIICLLFLEVTCNGVTMLGKKQISLNINIPGSQNNDNYISTMIHDYTFVNENSINTNNMTSFSLQFYVEQYNRQQEDIKDEYIILDWLSKFTTYKFKKPNTFEYHVSKEVLSLNRAIINATNGLLNMCDKMIEKTTSVLPLSYSYKFSTDLLMYSSKKEEGLGIIAGIAGLFTPPNANDNSLDDITNLEEKIMNDMYDFQLHRLSINNRDLFLNSLCDNTFSSPYTIIYNPESNSLSFTYDPNAVKYYIVIVQNIIDNSLIRGLNKGFKNFKGAKDINDYDNLRYDVELDIDKDKTTSLIEKAKFILPILQKLEHNLPTYLNNIAKKSLSINEYFGNLQQFWLNILDQSVIGSHDSPVNFKKELNINKQIVEDEIKAQIKADLDRVNELRASELEATRLLDEYKKKVLIDDVNNYIRQTEIELRDRNQNFSDKEWEQFNKRVAHHISGAIGMYDSTIDGVGKILYSTLSIPTNAVIDFASTQVSQIGKLFILIAGVLIIGLMTLFFIRLFIKRVAKILFFQDNTSK